MDLAAFQVVEHHRQAVGTPVHALACSASADMECTIDLGALLEPAHMWIKPLDWKKNEKKRWIGHKKCVVSI